MLKDIRNFFNGSVYGMTLIIPGISATILAIILGYYDELIHKMNHFKEDYRGSIRYLVVFVIGVAAGAVAFSNAVIYLLNNFSLPTMMLFAGLLTGIVPLTYTYARGNSKRIAAREIILVIISMIVLAALPLLLPDSDAGPAEPETSIGALQLLYIIFAGVVNGATLVIPGLSGAFILLIMGLYPLIISAISSIGTYLGDIRNLALLWELCVILVPYAVGALVGCIFMARLMEKLLRDFHKHVYAVILGLILGSLVALFQNPLVYQSGTSAPMIIAGCITFCGGFVIALLLGKKTKQE